MAWPPTKKFCDLDPIGCLEALLLVDDLLGKQRLGRVFPKKPGTLSENTLQNIFTSLQYSTLPKVGEYSMVPVLPNNSHQKNSTTQNNCLICNNAFANSKSLQTHIYTQHTMTKVYYCTFIH